MPTVLCVIAACMCAPVWGHGRKGQRSRKLHRRTRTRTQSNGSHGKRIRQIKLSHIMPTEQTDWTFDAGSMSRTKVTRISSPLDSQLTRISRLLSTGQSDRLFEADHMARFGWCDPDCVARTIQHWWKGIKKKMMKKALWSSRLWEWQRDEDYRLWEWHEKMQWPDWEAVDENDDSYIASKQRWVRNSKHGRGRKRRGDRRRPYQHKKQKTRKRCCHSRQTKRHSQYRHICEQMKQFAEDQLASRAAQRQPQLQPPPQPQPQPKLKKPKCKHNPKPKPKPQVKLPSKRLEGGTKNVEIDLQPRDCCLRASRF